MKKHKKKIPGRSKPRVWTCRRTLRLRAWDRGQALDLNTPAAGQALLPQRPAAALSGKGWTSSLHRLPGPAEGQTHLTSPGLQENLRPRATPSSSLELLASDRASLGAGLANTDIQVTEPALSVAQALCSRPVLAPSDSPGVLSGHCCWQPLGKKSHTTTQIGTFIRGWLADFRFPSALLGSFLCFSFFFKCSFIWLLQGLVTALRIFSHSHSIQTLRCGMWYLVPWPGIEPQSTVLAAQSLSHWTTKEAPYFLTISHEYGCNTSHKNHKRECSDEKFFSLPWPLTTPPPPPTHSHLPSPPLPPGSREAFQGNLCKYIWNSHPFLIFYTNWSTWGSPHFAFSLKSELERSFHHQSR